MISNDNAITIVIVNQDFIDNPTVNINMDGATQSTLFVWVNDTKYTSGFTLSGQNLTLQSSIPIALNDKVAIVRDESFTQQLNSSVIPGLIETLDNLTKMVQQVKVDSDRSIKADFGENPETYDFSILNINKNGKVFAFNADGSEANISTVDLQEAITRAADVPQIKSDITSIESDINSIDGRLQQAETDITGKQDKLNYTPERQDNKDVAGGYAGLDSNALLLINELPEISKNGVYLTFDLDKFDYNDKPESYIILVVNNYDVSVYARVEDRTISLFTNKKTVTGYDNDLVNILGEKKIGNVDYLDHGDKITTFHTGTVVASDKKDNHIIANGDYILMYQATDNKIKDKDGNILVDGTQGYPIDSKEHSIVKDYDTLIKTNRIDSDTYELKLDYNSDSFELIYSENLKWVNPVDLTEDEKLIRIYKDKVSGNFFFKGFRGENTNTFDGAVVFPHSDIISFKFGYSSSNKLIIATASETQLYINEITINYDSGNSDNYIATVTTSTLINQKPSDFSKYKKINFYGKVNSYRKTAQGSSSVTNGFSITYENISSQTKLYFYTSSYGNLELNGDFDFFKVINSYIYDRSASIISSSTDQKIIYGTQNADTSNPQIKAIDTGFNNKILDIKNISGSAGVQFSLDVISLSGKTLILERLNVTDSDTVTRTVLDSYEIKNMISPSQSDFYIDSNKNNSTISGYNFSNNCEYMIFTGISIENISFTISSNSFTNVKCKHYYMNRNLTDEIWLSDVKNNGVVANKTDTAYNFGFNDYISSYLKLQQSDDKVISNVYDSDSYFYNHRPTGTDNHTLYEIDFTTFTPLDITPAGKNVWSVSPISPDKWLLFGTEGGVGKFFDKNGVDINLGLNVSGILTDRDGEIKIFPIGHNQSLNEYEFCIEIDRVIQGGVQRNYYIYNDSWQQLRELQVKDNTGLNSISRIDGEDYYFFKEFTYYERFGHLIPWGNITDAPDFITRTEFTPVEQKAHEHSNKSIIDQIQQTNIFTAADRSRLETLPDVSTELELEADTAITFANAFPDFRPMQTIDDAVRALLGLGGGSVVINVDWSQITNKPYLVPTKIQRITSDFDLTSYTDTDSIIIVSDGFKHDITVKTGVVLPINPGEIIRFDKSSADWYSDHVFYFVYSGLSSNVELDLTNGRAIKGYKYRVSNFNSTANVNIKVKLNNVDTIIGLGNNNTIDIDVNDGQNYAYEKVTTDWSNITSKPDIIPVKAFTKSVDFNLDSYVDTNSVIIVTDNANGINIIMNSDGKNYHINKGEVVYFYKVGSTWTTDHRWKKYLIISSSSDTTTALETDYSKVPEDMTYYIDNSGTGIATITLDTGYENIVLPSKENCEVHFYNSRFHVDIINPIPFQIVTSSDTINIDKLVEGKEYTFYKSDSGVTNITGTTRTLINNRTVSDWELQGQFTEIKLRSVGNNVYAVGNTIIGNYSSNGQIVIKKSNFYMQNVYCTTQALLSGSWSTSANFGVGEYFQNTSLSGTLYEEEFKSIKIPISINVDGAVIAQSSTTSPPTLNNIGNILFWTDNNSLGYTAKVCITTEGEW